MRSFGAHLVIAVLAASCAAETASGGGPGGPKSGTWQGDEVSFVLKDGAIEELTFAKLQCSGDGCSGEAGGAISGRHALAGVIGIQAEGASFDGTFDTQTTASGSYAVPSSNGCCKAVGVWTAEWIKPLPGGSSSGGASSSGGGSSGGGEPTWNGSSTGDLHPGPSLSAPQHTDDTELSDKQNEALKRLNELRAQVGVAPVSQDHALTKAAQLHAEFYVQHASKYKANKLSPHNQDKSFGAGYTGKTLGERVKAAGYSGPPGPEVMAFTGSVAAAQQGWMDTVYHRLPLIDPRSTLMGFGMASSGKARTEVMDFGRGGSSGPIVVYPWPGQTGVPLKWSGNEGPQPPKPKTGYPSGPVITARFPGGPNIVSHQLLNSAGEDVPHVWLTPSNDPNLKMFDSSTVVIYANDPIPAGTYTVKLVVETAGAKKTLQWSFSAG